MNLARRNVFCILWALVLNKPFHWRKNGRGALYRLLRALIMEPYRFLRRLEPISLMKRIDRKLSLKQGTIIGGEMREKLVRIYSQQNAAIEREFNSAEVTAKYLFRTN
jgi:hypothetical protein